MAKQITQLPVAASVAASDVFPLDQSGTTKQATLTAIAAGLPASGTGGLVRQTNPIFSGGVTVNGQIAGVQTSITGISNTLAWYASGGSSPAGASNSGAWIGLHGGLEPTSPGALVFGCNTVQTGIVTPGGDFGFGTTTPAARAHVVAPTLASGTGSSVNFARFDNWNGSASSLRLSQVRTATGSNWETATTQIQQWTDVTPQGFVSFNEVNNPFGVSIGANDGVNNIPIVNIKASPGNFNVGIATTTTPSKLTVAGDIRIAQTGSLIFTDAAGTAPSFACQPDNNFVFYGTGSTGAPRAAFEVAMRSDASPLQVNVPLKIGGSGTAINTILTAFVTNYAPASIPANGGTQFLDVTVSGATVSSTICIVNHLGNLSNDSIIIKATCIAANTVRITWINPTTSSVSLSNIGYRITAIYI